jgi:hypothetical protein
MSMSGAVRNSLPTGGRCGHRDTEAMSRVGEFEVRVPARVSGADRTRVDAPSKRPCTLTGPPGRSREVSGSAVGNGGDP